MELNPLERRKATKRRLQELHAVLRDPESSWKTSDVWDFAESRAFGTSGNLLSSEEGDILVHLKGVPGKGDVGIPAVTLQHLELR